VTDETILDYLYHWEKTAPDTLHFVQPTGGGAVEEMTWSQIMDQVRRMAAHLKSLDFPPKSSIGLIGKNSAHWMMADWAIWMAGHVTVPIYPTLNADTVSYILGHSEARLLFIGKLDDWPSMAAGVAETLPRIALPLAPQVQARPWSEIIATTDALTGEPKRDPGEMATIVYTSGSTGQPKGVMQSFGALLGAGHMFTNTLGLQSQDRVLSYLPLAHVMERAAIEMPSVIAGLEVYFAEALDTFVEDLRRARPTLFISVPRLWTKFEQAVEAKMPKKKQNFLFGIPILGGIVKKKILTQLGLQHVRYAGTGSAPLAQSTFNWYRSLGLELLEGYGMTEDCAVSHATDPGDVKLGYVGKPRPGVETRIADNGELLVKSPGTMLGYYKEPEKTAEAFDADGFFKTGDMGAYDEQGRLRITGRVKELFKISKGKYVAPNPIENKLMAHPKLEVVCVAGANQPATFALVVLSEGARADLAAGQDRSIIEKELSQLMRKTNESLDPHEQMQFVVVVDEVWSIENGFLTPTMKIKRNVIEAHYADKIDSWFKQRTEVIWA
tara:strand:- start:1420 stop:3081 length:1662 start_codon:yes stop_codon:yes gene_type:complete